MECVKVLKYPGSKQRIVPWIVSQFPEHHSYLEPFLGSGAILLNKPKSHIETVNDLDDKVYKLFKLIREAPEELARAIALTPYSKTEYRATFTQERELSDLELVREFLVQCWQGYGFRTSDSSGWKNDVHGRERAYALRDWTNLPENILSVAERLKEVQITNEPAVQLIRRFNFSNVLIYADPPYLLSTRHGRQYRYEMSDQEHGELLEILLNHKGSVAISGYDNDLYNDMLADWNKKELAAYAEHGLRRTEVLWMNFEPTSQISLFSRMAVQN